MVAASLVPYLAAFTRHAIILMVASFVAPLIIWILSQNEKPPVHEKRLVHKKPPFHLSFAPVVIGLVILLVDGCLLNTPLTWLHINTVALMGAFIALDGMMSIRITAAKSTGSGTGTIEWSSPWAPLLVLVGFSLFCVAPAFHAGASRWLRENPTPLPPPQDMHPVVTIGLQVFASVCYGRRGPGAILGGVRPPCHNPHGGQRYGAQNEKPAVPLVLRVAPVVIGVVALLVDGCLLNTPLTGLHINTVTVMGFLPATDGITSIRITAVKTTRSGTGTIEWSGSPWAPLLVLVGFSLICTASGFAIGASRWLRENPTPLLDPQELHPAFNLGLPVVATACCLWGVFVISDKDGMPPARVWTMRALFLVQLVPIWWTFFKPATPAVSLA